MTAIKDSLPKLTSLDPPQASLYSLSVVFFWIILFFIGAANAKEYQACETVIFREGKIVLNKNEQILICGFNEGPEGWKTVPLTQAEFHISAVLQNLGYLTPRFERHDGTLHVWQGPQSEIKSLNVQGADGVLDSTKKRKIIHETLTPAKLNEVEAWANLGVRSRGYACPDIAVVAHGWTGSLHVTTHIGTTKQFGELIAQDITNLDSSVLSRYQPFKTKDLYDIRKTQIMTERMLADGLFQSAFFEKTCLVNTVNLELKTSMGPPRIVRFGVGASTEELPFADLSFRNTRLDDRASSLTAALHASPRKLSLTADSELYWIPKWTQAFLAPRLDIVRKMEPTYETDTSKLGLDLGFKWDLWDLRLIGRGGPSINSVKTRRGVGPNSNYPTIDASLTLMSHLYESLLWQQYEGWNASLFFRGQGKGLGSDVDVNRYEFNYKYLWNLQNFDPPLFILGTRVQGIFVDANDLSSVETASLIPMDDRIFAGGDQNLRGFPRQGISNNGFGYLSFLYLGFELRLIEELPYRLQPFLLWDLARTSEKRYTLDSTLFVSEGLGLRWLSPFGTLRGSVARGRILAAQPNTMTFTEKWIFFLSFGQEF